MKGLDVPGVGIGFIEAVAGDEEGLEMRGGWRDTQGTVEGDETVDKDHGLSSLGKEVGSGKGLQSGGRGSGVDISGKGASSGRKRSSTHFRKSSFLGTNLIVKARRHGGGLGPNGRGGIGDSARVRGRIGGNG